jgi:hypothetical protein
MIDPRLLDLELDMSGQLHAPADSSLIYWIGCWVGLRISLNDEKKITFLISPGLELRSLSRPARS